jgi:tripartite-type tricarboxylate transporter receptor subunit TctC
MTRRMFAIAALAVLAATGSPDAALAQFYKGKTITMIINYPAGGPSDIEGRIVAQHLPKHIPGNPTIVVKNISGGGGIIGTNALGDSPPNGEAIGFLTPDIIPTLLGNTAIKIPYSEFAMIAAVENPLVVYARKDTPPGLKTATDIMKASDFKALSLNAQSTNTLNQTLGLDLLGIKYQAVPAYRGLKEVETAILQNIGQVANSSLPGWSGSIVPTMGDVVMPLWQLSPRAKDGSYPRSKSIADIPTFEEFHVMAKGSKPSGILYEVMRTLGDPLTAMFRSAMMPPKSSNETVAIMRAAFVELWKDKDFHGDYMKIVKTSPVMRTGEEVQQVVAELNRVKPETKAFIVDYTNKLVGK